MNLQLLRKPSALVAVVLAAIGALAMLYYHVTGYGTSLDWQVSTEGQTDEVIVHQFEQGPFDLQLPGDRVTLLDTYFGSQIDLLPSHTTAFLGFIWLGILLLLTTFTYTRKWAFMLFSGLLIVFIANLRLHDPLGLSQWVLLLPILLIVGLAFGFHAYWTKVPFLVRWLSLIVFSLGCIWLIPGSIHAFSFYFMSEGMVGLSLVVLATLMLIAEEILFGFLYLITQAKGGSNNHQHFLILGGLYLINLLGYFLETHGIIGFSFAFFNPLVLFIISFFVAAWSLKFKTSMVSGWMSERLWQPMLAGLGIVSFGFLALSFAKGQDVMGGAIDYAVLYVHLGVGFIFFAYVVLNFLGPLSQGLKVYRIVYEPQSFHYVTARIGSTVAILALYFASGGAIGKFIKSTALNWKGDHAMLQGDLRLAQVYYGEADVVALNSHYPNYQLGMAALDRGGDFEARYRMDKANVRFPSPQSVINYGVLNTELDMAKAISQIELGMEMMSKRPEFRSNLALLYHKNGFTDKGLEYLDETASAQRWNQAPLVNKLALLAASKPEEDLLIEDLLGSGDLHVRTNAMSYIQQWGWDQPLEWKALDTTEFTNAFTQEAYFLNSLNLYLDTLLQSQVKNYFDNSDRSIFYQLKRAYARNLFLSGRTKKGLQEYDQLIFNSGGREKRILQREVGILLLNARAPRTALKFLNEAIRNGNDSARRERIIALMELNNFEEALFESELLSGMDSLQSNLYSVIYGLVNGVDSLANPQYRWYYQSIEMEADELSAVLPEMDVQIRAKTLERLYGWLQNRQTTYLMDQYQSTFSQYNISLENEELDEMDEAVLIAASRENPFDEQLVLAAWEVLRKQDEIEAYNLAFEAADFNTHSVALLRALTISAYSLNLPANAAEAMDKLSTLMTAQEWLELTRELTAIRTRFAELDAQFKP